ncbi:Hypothetical protein ADU69_0649 [Pediococcus damnosus]|uniref:hypothetical protein n=1 Tax=Pediococcus damnosus TaxID=51663 RepID=UPI00078E1C08|nr:hypothetical protein [Pediococcus damnosus]AMV60318.1 Hypothetical protein ADU69_0649 [Pediococcus damnosus]
MSKFSKLSKFLPIVGIMVFGLLFGAENSVSAKTVSALNGVRTSYNASKKVATFSGRTSSKFAINRVALTYNNGKKVYVNVHKGTFKISEKFQGYKTFTLYGTNKRNKRVTKVYKLGSNKYASQAPVILKLNHGNKNGNVALSVRAQKNSVVHVYNGSKKVGTVKGNGKTQTLQIKNLKNKTAHLRLNAKMNKLKTSQDTYTPRIKQRIIYQVSF